MILPGDLQQFSCVKFFETARSLVSVRQTTAQASAPEHETEGLPTPKAVTKKYLLIPNIHAESDKETYVL
jgi:hypothetical protein